MQNKIVGTPFEQLVVVIVAVCALHCAFLAFNFVVCQYALRLNRPDYKACFICCSQKTLPVAGVTPVSASLHM